MKISLFWFTFFGQIMLICCARRFCIWVDHQAIEQKQQKQKTSINTVQVNFQRKKSINTLHMNPSQTQQIIKQKQQDFTTLLHKNQEFRSYHPHYLHSYSYPEPITPHIYFGQLNSQSNYIFLIKHNQTFQNSQITNQIYYVNGKKQYGVKNLLQKQKNLRQNNNGLNFAMIIQVQSMVDKQIVDKVYVYNFGNYLGVVCEVNENYYKVFIVYISNNGKNAMNLSETNSQFTIQFKNITQYNNKNNWKLTHQSHKVVSYQNLKLSNDPTTANIFNTFVMIIKYNSLKNAQKYKIAVRELPFRDQQIQQTLYQIHSHEEALSRIKQVKINSFQYRFQIVEENVGYACQTRAQNQLLQGLSYQYGTLVLRNGSRNLPNQPKQLYSFSPSRKRFPWGFLWDDGFHCQIAVRTEGQIALKVIKSWLNTMLQFGWIPRQQNRGQQRQFLCSCPDFMVKDVRDGNPPTLLLALNFLARKNVLSRQNFQQKYWKRLQNWYKWFSQTQTDQIGSYIFRWYDSIQGPYSFNSGMDDFPRQPGTNGHVDCQSWMYFFAQTMSTIGQKLKYNVYQYRIDAQKIKINMIQHFIDPQLSIPQDFVRRDNTKIYNNHFGYPSILPIAFGIINQSSLIFTSTIQKIKNQLDSGHGLRSLSKRDSNYLAPNAYWRGPVWININYLFIRGLHLHYKSQTQYYSKLRNDLITTVCSEEEQRGYFYENYIQGKGSFSYPFTGWTALISIIIRQNY